MDSPLNSTNATNSTSHEEPNIPFPSQYSALAWLFLIPFTLVGNAFVIRTVLKVSKMKSPTNILFVNMAACDIMTALTLIPHSAVLFYQQSFTWFSGTFGVVSCKTILYLGYVTIAGSIVSLTMMAIDRYFAICCPILNVNFFKRYKMVSAMVWVPSLIIMIPVAIYSDITYRINECHMFLPNSFSKFFHFGFFLLLYLAPLLIMAILYGLIAKELWWNKTPTILASEEEKIQKREQKKRKVVVMVLIVLAVFAVCWLPDHVRRLYLIMGQQMNIDFAAFAMWLSHANSAINPILYITLHSGFRKAFKQCLYNCGFPVKQPTQEQQYHSNSATQRLRISDPLITSIRPSPKNHSTSTNQHPRLSGPLSQQTST